MIGLKINNKLTYLPIFLFFITVSGIFSQQRLQNKPNTGMEPLDMKISNDGKHIITAYDSCTIVWDITKREIIRRIPRNLSYFSLYNRRYQALNNDGSILAVGDDRLLILYNTENQRLIKKLTVLKFRENPNTTDAMGFSTMIAWTQEHFKQIFFTPDNKYIIVITNEDKIMYVDYERNTIRTVNVYADKSLRPFNEDILDINISQGRVAIRDNNKIIVINLYSQKKEGEIPLEYNNSDFYSRSLSLSNNVNKHSILLAENNNEYYLLVCDIGNRKIINSRKINGKANIVKLTALENIAALARDDSICLYNFQTGIEIANLIAYEEPKPPITSPPKSEPVIIPTSTPFIMPIKTNTVQLGSFSSFRSALRLVNRIEDEGFKPFIECAKINNSTFWRVVISDVLEVNIPILLELLENAGFTDIWLRPDNSESLE